MVYSAFSHLFATLLSNRLHHSYLIHHTHSFSHYLFPIHIPFNDPLSNAFERNSPFFPLSHSFHTASIDNILSFFPISYFQMTKTQLRISRRNLIEKQHNCSSIISIINNDPLINLLQRDIFS